MTIRNFEKYGSGNNMVNQEERGDPPDDLVICPECPTWSNKHHADNMVRVADDLEVCQGCFESRKNEFHCKNPECNLEDFIYVGIPASCPECRSAKFLWHDFYRFPKQQESTKRNWKGDKI